jgi:hypothetical protein
MITRDDQPVAVPISLPGEVSDVIVDTLVAALVASFRRDPFMVRSPGGMDRGSVPEPEPQG